MGHRWTLGSAYVKTHRVALFEPLKICHSLDVSACHNGSCLYQVSCDDESYTIGDFTTESLTLDPSSADRITVGCGHDNEGFQGF
ncbi:hypothetical protein QJS10_CPB21g00739 [Acorus calamus]|uniref:Xylanase inhibitor N-terminal domain-containing protein n=1 Tax=Acorus calamus TaxID=4465 RepID=A0AAV9C732_ACOCL|nr:hypothetical protein QJS10_CPB21g00739 [Acorus calamus]